MTRQRLTATLVGVVVVAALLTGCGGGDEANEATAHLTKAQYEQRAKAICAQAHAQIGEGLAALPRKIARGDAIGRAEAREALTEVILPRVRSQYEAMRRLPPPRGDEDFLDLMLSTLSRSLETGEESLARFFHIKASAYTEFGEATVMTGEYGVRGCGSFGHSAQEVVGDYLRPIPGPSAPLG
jgi:hypothetical protein